MGGKEEIDQNKVKIVDVDIIIKDNEALSNGLIPGTTAESKIISLAFKYNDDLFYSQITENRGLTLSYMYYNSAYRVFVLQTKNELTTSRTITVTVSYI